MDRHLTKKIVNKYSGKTVGVTSKAIGLEYYYLDPDCITNSDFLENEYHYWLTDTRVPKIGEPCKCGKYKFHGEK